MFLDRFDLVKEAHIDECVVYRYSECRAESEGDNKTGHADERRRFRIMAHGACIDFHPYQEQKVHQANVRSERQQRD